MLSLAGTQLAPSENHTTTNACWNLAPLFASFLPKSIAAPAVAAFMAGTQGHWLAHGLEPRASGTARASRGEREVPVTSLVESLNALALVMQTVKLLKRNTS